MCERRYEIPKIGNAIYIVAYFYDNYQKQVNVLAKDARAKDTVRLPF